MKDLYALVALLCFGFNLSFSQSGSIAGKVLDLNGQPVTGATIRLLDAKKGTLTNKEGDFTLKNIPAGDWPLEIKMAGYVTYEEKVSVEAGKTTTVSITLKEDPAMLEDVVIEAKTEAREISQQPIQVTSINLQPIQVESANAVAVLDRTAGVRVRQAGGLGSGATVQLNGFTGRAVRIYYDGIPLELFGGVQLNNLPVNAIDRIDVYKGVMPVDVGTDALAGGINIVPKQVLSNYMDASYQHGSFNTHVLTFGGNKVFKNNFSVGVNAFFNYSDNDYEMDVNSFNPNIFNTEPIRVRRFHNSHQSSMLQVNLNWKDRRWADRLSLSGGISQVEDEIQHGVRVAERPVGDATRGGYSLFQLLKYEKRLFNDKLKIGYFGNFSFVESRVDDSTDNYYLWTGEVVDTILFSKGAEVLAFPSRRRGENLGTTHRFTAGFSFSPRHVIKFSNFFGHQSITGEDPLVPEDLVDLNQFPSKLTKNIAGLSYESKWLKDKLSSILFGKHYYYENVSVLLNTQTNDASFLTSNVIGREWGYGAGLKYEFTPDFFIRGSYERALRVPDDFEVFGDFVTIAPNFFIRPELSRNFNVGAFYMLRLANERSFSINLNVFLREQFKLIRLRAGRSDSEPGQYINEDEVDAQGIETSIKLVPVKWLELGANVTYQEQVRGGVPDPGNTNLVGADIPNVPFFFYNLSARSNIAAPWQKAHRITSFVYYNYVQEFSLVLEGSAANRDNIIPTQNQMDAGITYTMPQKNLSFSFQVNNVLNAEVFDNYRVPRPGRNLQIKVRYYFTK